MSSILTCYRYVFSAERMIAHVANTKNKDRVVSGNIPFSVYISYTALANLRLRIHEASCETRQIMGVPVRHCLLDLKWLHSMSFGVFQCFLLNAPDKYIRAMGAP